MSRFEDFRARLSQNDSKKNQTHTQLLEVVEIECVCWFVLLYSTCASPVVPHPSTRHAHGCLASEIGRDPAFPARYDRTGLSPVASNHTLTSRLHTYRAPGKGLIVQRLIVCGVMCPLVHLLSLSSLIETRETREGTYTQCIEREQEKRRGWSEVGHQSSHSVCVCRDSTDPTTKA